jgi:hypothetical protein
LNLHFSHVLQVLNIGVINIIEYQIAWRASTSIVKKYFKVVVQVRAIDKADVLIQSELYLEASHNRDCKEACSNTEDHYLTKLIEDQGNIVLLKHGSHEFFSGWYDFLFHNAKCDIGLVLLNTLAIEGQSSDE